VYGAPKKLTCWRCGFILLNDKLFNVNVIGSQLRFRHRRIVDIAKTVKDQSQIKFPILSSGIRQNS